MLAPCNWSNNSSILGNEYLISSPSIFQPKGHHFVIVQSSVSDEGCSLLVYLEKAFIKLRSSYPKVESTRRSIQGRGKLIFEYALFRSVKSTHILHLLFDFLTNNIWPTTQGNPLSWWILLVIAFPLPLQPPGSRVKLLRLCFTGWWLGSTFSLWTITRGVYS